MDAEKKQEPNSQGAESQADAKDLDPTLAQRFQTCMIGAAVFDLSGLPKEYFTAVSGAGSSTTWVQTAFQALGLRSLLSSSLQLEGFRHAIIQGQGYSALVVKQNGRYIALLTSQEDLMTIGESFIQWARQFEPSDLRTNPRFRVT